MKPPLHRLVLLTAASAMACCAPALAGPREEVDAAIARFAEARSYRASMTATGPQPIRSELEFVAPDRYRMTMPGVGAQTIVGDTMYMNLQGRTMKVPLPKGALGQWNDPDRLAQNTRDMQVTALGVDAASGSPARRYQVRFQHPDPGEMTLWVGADGYPSQIVTGGDSSTTIRYSDFNDPSIRIAAP